MKEFVSEPIDISLLCLCHSFEPGYHTNSAFPHWQCAYRNMIYRYVHIHIQTLRPTNAPSAKKAMRW